MNLLPTMVCFMTCSRLNTWLYLCLPASVILAIGLVLSWHGFEQVTESRSEVVRRMLSSLLLVNQNSWLSNIVPLRRGKTHLWPQSGHIHASHWGIIIMQSINTCCALRGRWLLDNQCTLFQVAQRQGRAENIRGAGAKFMKGDFLFYLNKCTPWMTTFVTLLKCKTIPQLRLVQTLQHDRINDTFK